MSRLIALAIVPFVLISQGCNECKSNEKTICRHGVTYWVDSCGNEESMAGYCVCGCNADFTGCMMPCDCVPSCFGKECGPNGCGGVCEPGCGTGERCNDNGQCEPCEPDCVNRECGDDGCGGFCGVCNGDTEYCSTDGECTNDCEGRECGPSPVLDVSCGRCSENPTDYCATNGQCEDDCADRECGLSPNVGHNCGTCPGATDYCADGICIDDCDGRVCGPSANEGFNCGTCTGDTEYCTLSGNCEDDCASMECGFSPNQGFLCGECAGQNDYCNALGQCEDDCAGRVCGPSPHEGHDCGTCPGLTDYCTENGQCVDDCAGRVCGRSPTSVFDCGTCPGETDFCSADGQCVDDCAGRECGVSPNAGYSCGSCLGDTSYCAQEFTCVDDCAGRVCGQSPVMNYDCGQCTGATEYCSAGGQCIEDCQDIECGYSPEMNFLCGVCEDSQICVHQQCTNLWVYIPGGVYTMGSDEYFGPPHSVTIQPFELTKTEITLGKYQECIDAGVCSDLTSHHPLCNHFSVDNWEYPVNCPYGYQANDFCTWIGGRLPSEAEWEYAARNNGVDPNPWGNEPTSCEYAVIGEASGENGCGTGATWPVCMKPEGNTVHGLCDMSGNVSEMMQDHWSNTYDGAPDDGSAWEHSDGATRVQRGAHFEYGSGDNTSILSSRDYYSYNYPDNFRLGFRCARDVSE